MKQEHIINLQGKDYIKHEGLLAMFHENNGKEIVTELLSYENGVAVFKATATGDRGTFTGHGDADDNNVNRNIIPHKLRMAETRAVNRALRFYNNIGMCSVDELGGDDKPAVNRDTGFKAENARHSGSTKTYSKSKFDAQATSERIFACKTEEELKEIDEEIKDISMSVKQREWMTKAMFKRTKEIESK